MGTAGPPSAMHLWAGQHQQAQGAAGRCRPAVLHSSALGIYPPAPLVIHIKRHDCGHLCSGRQGCLLGPLLVRGPVWGCVANLLP